MPTIPGLVLTNKGKLGITGRIKGSGSEPKYVGMGTGGITQTAAVTNTTLQLQVGTRSGTNVGTISTTTTTNDTYNISQTITAGTTYLVDEAGIFDASSSGNMYLSATFLPVTLNSGDQIQFNFSMAVT